MRLYQKLLLCLAIFTLPLVLKSQQLEYQHYNWDKAPRLHKLSPEDNTFPEVILKEKQAIEYAFDDEGSLSEYYLVHKIIKLAVDLRTQRGQRLSVALPTFLVRDARTRCGDDKSTPLREHPSERQLSMIKHWVQTTGGFAT